MSVIEREVVEAPAVAPVTPSILDPRVERGAQRMDERCPGWADKVNPDTLELRSDCRCILGQVYGSFNDSYMRVAGEPGGMFDLGFYAGGGSKDFDALEQDWRLAILSRRTP